MSYCNECRASINWKTHQDGSRVPYSENGSMHYCSSYTPEPSYSGWALLSTAFIPTIGVLHHNFNYRPKDDNQPLTYPTTCWTCGAEIFFHSNGYGDMVLFDKPLGP